MVTKRARTQANPTSAEPAGDGTRGWYLYGIARRQPLAAVLADEPDGSMFGTDATDGLSDPEPIQLLEYSGVVAVVRPVLLADFSQTVLEERLRTVSELEAMVRNHHRVIEAIHAQQAILPAKFGMVYVHAWEIVAALRAAHETLVRELDRLEGCDEWAVHLFADATVIRDRVSAADSRIQRLRQESAAAGPGRAYFLERQIRGQLDASTRDALTAIAQQIFDRLRGCAVNGQASVVGASGDTADEVEILRAAFLVLRDGSERFMAEVRASADSTEGLRSECSGPWPPYSFAAGQDEDAQ